MDHDGAREPIELADADLVLRSRSGDRGAFGELWRRHYRAGVTVARNLTSSLDADDLVQEAYTRIYQSIVTGRGPTGSFRAYLFTSIRNTAASWGRAQRDAAYDTLDGVEDPSAQEHASEAALDRGLTHQAFRSLPTRWQEVLWYSEIEQMKPAEIAPLLGMKPTAVAQLTFRAREGLREAWIQAHLRTVADGSDCQWTIERLGAHSRHNLGRRDRSKVDRHLAECVRCSIVAGEAQEVSSRLALVLLPLALGATGAAGYLATLQGGSAPLVTLAAMPSGVVQGAVAAIPTVTKGAAAGGVGAGAASGAGGASVGLSAAGGSATTASASAAGTIGVSAATATATAAGVSGSALAGVGAASGIAASLVVVGGVVAAAVVLPTAAPDRVEPEPTSVSNTVPVTPGLLSSEDDPAGLVDSGPGPADIPVIPDPIEDAAGGTTDSPPTDDGAATAGGTTGSGQTDADRPARGGNGAPSEPGSGSGATPATPGNGTPTNGTGSGNGGVTGNDGATGSGTPTNGTGNGNGGVPGNGNAVPGAGNANHGKGNGNGATDQENVPTGLGRVDLPTPMAAPATAGASVSDPADAVSPSGADADGESPAPDSI